MAEGAVPCQSASCLPDLRVGFVLLAARSRAPDQPEPVHAPAGGTDHRLLPCSPLQPAANPASKAACLHWGGD